MYFLVMAGTGAQADQVLDGGRVFAERTDVCVDRAASSIECRLRKAHVVNSPRHFRPPIYDFHPLERDWVPVMKAYVFWVT